MMVPRSFQHGAGSRTREFDEKDGRKKNSYNMIISARVPRQPLDAPPRTMTGRPDVSSRAVSEPLAIPSRTTDHRRTTPVRISRTNNKTVPSKHRSDALAPSVAALLAMTAIPPMRPHQSRRRRTTDTPQMTIDELVTYWKSDSSLRSSVGSSPSMSVLLDAIDDSEELHSRKASVEEPSFCSARSTSTDSIPSLDADDSSSLSVRSPSTPASLRSRRSITNLRREKSKSSSVGEECLFDHPLIAPLVDPEEYESEEGFPHTRQTPTRKSRSSFRSNLTTSLQALKNAALGSLAFKSQSQTRDGPKGGSQLADDVLWSHPFLFPRLSPEIRPSIQGTPTQAQRRYLNPMPLTFEEQEAPFQQALHAPYLAEAVEEAPLIQLQPYSRNRRRATRTRSKTPDPQSEAGRVQQLTTNIRQRETRENADFLRVVVLEMNMRRAGKLEVGRAKIWLPPRQVGERAEVKTSGQVPARWVGICA
ncbi:hypothetical protein AMS68_000471 [Peltaster fructicola]|uniref:Uncharacterized protein n=1 Tax=Peltaster fructicola TaxID=286661 RepID=A0A6H0XJQ7_9PEZI|nr:hypothetical protein AMS68_000471 [Peltaster fructicola]